MRVYLCITRTHTLSEDWPFGLLINTPILTCINASVVGTHTHNTERNTTEDIEQQDSIGGSEASSWTS